MNQDISSDSSNPDSPQDAGRNSGPQKQSPEIKRSADTSSRSEDGPSFDRDSLGEEALSSNTKSRELRLNHWSSVSEQILDELSVMVRDWGRKLESLGFDDFSWCLGGSMKCGHFMGPKPSRNPDIDTDEVVEVDYRLMLPDSIDPTDIAVKNKIAHATGLEWKKDYDERRWKDAPAPQSIFYGYIPMESLGGQKLEVELSVQRNSQWVEVAEYWQKIFSADEIKLQAFRRDQLRQDGHDYESTIRPLKHFQCDEARWRILAGFASGRFQGPVPTFIEDLVQDWWKRDIPSKERIADLPLSPELKESAEPPKWVKAAIAEATTLKERAKSSYSA